MIVAILLAGELVARFVFGLGDPPLLMADPGIQYLFRPNQDCWRQGNRVKYNAYSMRSEDFPATKTNPAELRVMVFGDSIVNGGNLTDQAELATTLLGPALSARLQRPVIVGNISAGTWGPPNQLAYARRFGLFGADVVVIVASSHDAADVPREEPLPGPTEKPWSALVEGLTRYSFANLLDLIRGDARPTPGDPIPPPPTMPADEIARALADLKSLIAMARSGGVRVIVVQHLDLAEAQGSPTEGHALIRSAAEEAGAQVVQLGPAMSAQLKQGPNPYRDSIHPNAVGQKILAAEMEQTIVQTLEKK